VINSSGESEMDNTKIIDISIVIPVYNTETWLRQCIDSVLNQEYKVTQIILIDDGSTDSSGVICDEYAQNYERIETYHIANSGAGAARNMGIRLAKAEWVAFVDSDDYLDEKYTNCMFEAIDNTADIVLFNGKVLCDEAICDREHIRNPYIRCNEIKVFENGNLFFDTCIRAGIYTATVCTAVYKRTLVQRFIFPEGVIFEDEYYAFVLMLNAGKVKCIPESLYCRRFRVNSVMTTRYELKRIHDWNCVYEQIMRYIEANKEKLNLLRESIYQYLFRNCSIVMHYLDDAIANGVYVPIDTKDRIKMTIRDGLRCMLDYKDDDNGNSFEQNILFCRIVTRFESLLKTNISLDEWEQIKSQLNNQYRRILVELDLKNPDKIYAIYGVGKHTEGLISMYRSVVGNIKSRILYCVTKPQEGEKYEGNAVFAVSNLPRTLDGVIISSFEHRLEMRKQIADLGLPFLIIDFYENCNQDMFSWYVN